MDLFRAHGAAETARILGVNQRSVYTRRANLEKNLDVLLVSPGDPKQKERMVSKYPARIPISIQSGIMMVAGVRSRGSRCCPSTSLDFGDLARPCLHSPIWRRVS